MQTKIVILDFDGTLGDTRMNIVKTLQQTLAQCSLPVAGEAECAATIGIPLFDAFLQLVPTLTKEQAQECVDIYRDIFEVNKKKLMPKPFPHVLDTMRSLTSRGVILTIASSRSNTSLHGFVEEMGMEPYVKYVIGAEDVVNAKPQPEPVLKTLSHFGLSAADALVVGDMHYDILMGKNAGARTCGVTYGNATRRQLADSGATYIIDDFAQLLDIVCQ
ncbi:MAG: HAD family hydrolase [Prevotella sp.]|nr:HAD family hydrolase [Prevotella sp.]